MSNECNHNLNTGTIFDVTSINGRCHNCNKFYHFERSFPFRYLRDEKWGDSLMHVSSSLDENFKCPGCGQRFFTIHFYCDKNSDPAHWWNQKNEMAKRVMVAVEDICIEE